MTHERRELLPAVVADLVARAAALEHTPDHDDSHGGETR